jgi:hypothetical protein
MTASSRLLFIGAAGCLLCAPALLADSLLTQTCVIAPLNMAYNSTNCVFNYFNTSLGTLDNVTLQIASLDGTGYAQQFNPGGPTASFTDSAATFALTGNSYADGTRVTATATSGSCGGSVQSGTTNNCASTALSGADGVVNDAASPGDYAAVSGQFSVHLTANYTASGTITSGQLTFTGAGSIGFSVVVTYYYIPYASPTPEPGTPILCGGLLLILTAFVRRRLRGKYSL